MSNSGGWFIFLNLSHLISRLKMVIKIIMSHFCWASTPSGLTGSCWRQIRSLKISWSWIKTRTESLKVHTANDETLKKAKTRLKLLQTFAIHSPTGKEASLTFLLLMAICKNAVLWLELSSVFWKNVHQLRRVWCRKIHLKRSQNSPSCCLTGRWRRVHPPPSPRFGAAGLVRKATEANY